MRSVATFVVLACALALVFAAQGSAGPRHAPRRCRRHVHRHARCRRPAARPQHRSPTPAPGPALPSRTGVDEGEYYVTPSHPTVAAGTVELDPVDLGMDPHNFSVRDAAGRVVTGVALGPGESQQLSVKLPVGTYTLYCSLYDHERLGMHATLTVR